MHQWLARTPRTASALMGLVMVVALAGCRRKAEPRPAPAGPASVATAPERVAPSAGPAAECEAAPIPSAGAKVPSSGDGQGPSCASEPWLTYGHDPARSSASRGCCFGPLRPLWRATLPVEIKVRPPMLEHAIATEDTIFASGLKGKSTTLHRFDRDGNRLWTFDSRADLHLSNWPTYAHDLVVVLDDGFYMVDPLSGKSAYARGLDYFGQSLFDDERFYAVNTWHVEGPGLFVGGFTRDGTNIWKANKYGSEPHDMMDDLGGLALDNGVLFQAANYKFAPFSGVFAFDARTGEMRWSREAKPIGYPSAGDGRVYVVEKGSQGRHLVARSQADGEVFWSTPLPSVRAAAPTLAFGLVIVDTERDGIHALEADTGKIAWVAPLKSQRKSPQVGFLTTMAAALGSRSLVATVDDTIHVISLEDGSVKHSLCPVERQEIHSPIIVGGRVYVVSGGELVALGPD